MIGLSVGMVFFIVSIKAYTIGLKHGKEIKQGNTPEIKVNPVTIFKDHKQEVENKKQNDLVMEGINNILSYNGLSQEDEK